MSTTSTQNDDTLYGTENGETINGQQGNDVIYGYGGNDILHGNKDNDTLYGGEGNDELYGGNGEDNLWGQEGNDELYGGGGADKFHFSFSQSGSGSTTVSFSKWVAEQTGGKEVDDLTQGEFSSLYTNWIEGLLTDLGVSGFKVDINQNDASDTATPKIYVLDENGDYQLDTDLSGMFGDREHMSWTSASGKKTVTHTRYYSDEFTIPGGPSLSSTDGHDWVMDFNKAQGDQLVFNGITLTADEFNSMFTVTSDKDMTGDNTVDTVISLKDGSWSVTLNNYTTFDFNSDVLFG